MLSPSSNAFTTSRIRVRYWETAHGEDRLSFSHSLDPSCLWQQVNLGLVVEEYHPGLRFYQRKLTESTIPSTIQSPPTLHSPLPTPTPIQLILSHHHYLCPFLFSRGLNSCACVWVCVCACACVRLYLYFHHIVTVILIVFIVLFAPPLARTPHPGITVIHVSKHS